MKKKTRNSRPKKTTKQSNPEPKTPQKFVSCIDYARHRGVSKQAVSKALKSGRIRSTEINGKLFIDVEAADRDWNSNTKDKYLPERDPQPRRQVEPDDTCDDDGDDGGDDLDPDIINDGNAGEYRRISEARKLIWEARQARLDYLREVGELVPTDKVKKEAFELARIVRDSVLNIPDRISAELVGIKDQAAMHSVLTRELNLALQELVDRDLMSSESNHAEG